MNAKGHTGLTYTEDFSIACTINYLKQEDVLQYFINRVSFYAFNGGEMEAVALWATNIIIDCKEALGVKIRPSVDKRVQRISMKYIGLLYDLQANDELSTVDKMRESIYLMQDWETEMLPHPDYPETFKLDDDRNLLLTFDFNLLCKMNGVSATEALQYFIDQISLAQQRAVNFLIFQGTSTSMSVFGVMLLSRSMKKVQLPFQEDIHLFYTDKLLALDERLKEEHNIAKRLSVYKAFYAEWYSELIKSLN
jgi:hypothetical protein